MNTPIYDPVNRKWVNSGMTGPERPGENTYRTPTYNSPSPRPSFMPEGWVPNEAQRASGILPPPGERYGVTGGLLPFQGDPLPAAPDVYEAGRKDRMQANDYYSGVTGTPRISEESQPSRAAFAPTVKPGETYRVGERNPTARQPGSGQGVIRKGNQVFGYNDGVQVLNPDGTPREFMDEDEAMNFLDSLRAPAAAAPSAAAPQAGASPLSNPGAVTTRAQKAQAAPAAPMASHQPAPVSADGRNRAMVDAASYAPPAPGATPPGMLPSAETVQAARGAPPLNTFDFSRQTPMREETRASVQRAMNPTAQAPAPAVTSAPRIRAQEYPAGVPATARRAGEWWNEATKRAAWNPPPGDIPAETERRAGSKLTGGASDHGRQSAPGGLPTAEEMPAARGSRRGGKQPGDLLKPTAFQSAAVRYNPFRSGPRNLSAPSAVAFA